MTRIATAALAALLLIVVAPSAAQGPGTMTSALFDPDTDTRAPEGLTWMSCFLTLGWVGSPYGSVGVFGGPYLIERPEDYSSAVQQQYSQAFASEYLQARPQEFPKHEPKDAFASQRGCIIGSHSHDTARFWNQPRRNPQESLKTDFVPSFAK